MKFMKLLNEIKEHTDDEIVDSAAVLLQQDWAHVVVVDGFPVFVASLHQLLALLLQALLAEDERVIHDKL